MYQHILLTTELNNQSIVVEDKAAAIQKLTGAKLSIIHVIEPLPAIYSVGEAVLSFNYQDTQELLKKNVNERLESVKERLNISDAVIAVEEGLVSDEVMLYSERGGVDLIVAGSHGRHGSKRLLGSSVNSILHCAKCDVLAVWIKDGVVVETVTIK